MVVKHLCRLFLFFSCGMILRAAMVNPAVIDLDRDRFIDITDAGVLWDAWLSHSGPSADWNPACDVSIPADGIIDAYDLLKLSADWLVTIPEPNAFICPPDVNGDGRVNTLDLALLSAAWRTDAVSSVNWNPACDISNPPDGVIDAQDLTVMADTWLRHIPDPNAYSETADINRDRTVDGFDFGWLSAAWYSDDQPPENWNRACDVAPPADGRVDQSDFAAFSYHWQFLLPDPNQFIFIPGGPFEMGDHHDFMFEARPVHTVRVDSFYMGKYPVTNQQYCRFLNESMADGILKVEDGLVYAADDAANSLPYFGTNAVNNHSRITYTEGRFVVIDNPDHPLVQVNWYGAVVYCNWLSRRQGRPACYDLLTWECDFTQRGYRLATEAEWEYAARGGEKTPYYRYSWGDAIDGSKANYYHSGDPFPSTTPVGYFNGSQVPAGVDMANGYGLYDMAGNVLEWCGDWYGNNYYQVSPVDNPRGPAQGTARVLRGGSWNNPEKQCRVSYRDCYHNPLDRSGSYGFRVCLPLPAGR